MSASGEGSTIPSSTVNPIPAGDAIVTGFASTVPKLAVKPIPVTGANAHKPEAPQTSDPQVSLPQPCSLYASTVPEDTVKPIPVNITSGAGSTVPSAIFLVMDYLIRKHLLQKILIL
jgi:hypothetical protein